MADAGACHYKIESPVYQRILHRFSARDSIDWLEQYVGSIPSLPQPFVRIYSQGKFVSNQAPLNGRSLAKLSALGATVVLKQVDLFDADMRDACEAFSRERHAPVHANIYYTPANQKGFRAHFDFHDTILWQLFGAKSWSTWAQPLPVAERVNDSSVIDQACRHRKKSSFILDTGFALEIPTGLIHCASAEKTGSIHITFGVYRDSFCFYWLEILAEFARIGKSERHLSEALTKTLRAKASALNELSPKVISELDAAVFSGLLDYARGRAGLSH